MAQIDFNNMKLSTNKGHIGLSLSMRQSSPKINEFKGQIGLLCAAHVVNQVTTKHILTLSFEDSDLNITHMDVQTPRATGSRYDILWTAKSARCTAFLDKFQLRGAHWYGAGQVRNQLWPIEKWQRKMEPFLAGDSFADDIGGVQERYWLASNGCAIFADRQCPLFVAFNGDDSGYLTLCASMKGPYKASVTSECFLKYSIFQARDAREVHELMLCSGVIAKPIDIPDETLFRKPIWTTWARFKKNIDQDTVVSLAKEIKEHGFKVAQIEIDDDWTPRYGDMTFDIKKFPDPKNMVSQLADLGCRVTLWVHPFCSLDSEASKMPYWMEGSFGGSSVWWNGIGKCLDITNSTAVTWFQSALTKLQNDIGITSFKFDAGELNWLPSQYTSFVNMQSPNEYATKWAELAYVVDREIRCQEVRVGVHSQNLPIFVRMMDKDSNWTYENGLRTLIPHSLTFGLLGYPFVLPDMIGGNAYQGEFPESELFVRWLQVNVFMPAMQFSICPWQYGAKVNRIAKAMVELHERYSAKLIELANHSVTTGFPINRPLWWIAPDDEVAQVIDSEFLVGDDLLVAPVLHKGDVSRDVYLPEGRWRDEVSGAMLEGGRWYRDHPAPLEVLPYFTRVNSRMTEPARGISKISAMAQKVVDPEVTEPLRTSPVTISAWPTEMADDQEKKLIEEIRADKSAEKELLSDELNDILNTA